MKTNNLNPAITNFDAFNVELTPPAGSVGTVSSPETHVLGEIIVADDRWFRYALSGASTLTPGNLALSPVQKANHQSLTPTATTTIAGTTVSVTLGATAAVVGEYNEGTLAVVTGTGQGAQYKISSNPAISSSGVGIITLFDPVLNNNITASNTVTLIHNKFNGTVTGTVQTRRAAGVSMSSPTAAQYYWSQTRGIAATLADGTVAIGSLLTASGSTAGAVTAVSGTWATALAQVLVGQALEMAGAASTSNPVWLMID